MVKAKATLYIVSNPFASVAIFVVSPYICQAVWFLVAEIDPFKRTGFGVETTKGPELSLFETL